MKTWKHFESLLSQNVFIYLKFWSIMLERKGHSQSETRYINIIVDSEKKTIFMIKISHAIYMSFQLIS